MAGKDRIPIFRERLTDLRKKELKMTQEEFAEHIGIARPTVGLYESGERIPDVGVLAKIARTCNKSADWLIGLSDVPEVDEIAQAASARYGLSNSSLESLEYMLELQGEEVYGMNIDYRSALNALLPTKQFILLLRYMEIAKASREYAKNKEEERAVLNDINCDTGKKPDGFESWPIEEQDAYREQEDVHALDSLRSVIEKTADIVEPIKAYHIAKKHRGVWLDAGEAVGHYARQAEKRLEEAISAYYDGRAEELDIFQRAGDPDA